MIKSERYYKELGAELKRAFNTDNDHLCAHVTARLNEAVNQETCCADKVQARLLYKQGYSEAK